MQRKEGNLYKIYQLAFEDRYRFYRALIISGLIFGFLFLATYFSFFLIKNGFKWGNFLGASLFWFFALALFNFLSLGVNLKNFFTSLFLLPLAFISAFFFLGYPLESWVSLLIFYLISFVCLLFSALLFRSEADNLVNLSFYRIFRRGSYFLAVIVLGVFYLLLSWSYSLNFENIGDFLIDRLPLPFNYSVDDFLLKSLKGEINFFGVGLNFGTSEKQNFQRNIPEDLKKILEEYNLKGTLPTTEEISFQPAQETVISQLRSELEKFFNQSLNGQENMNLVIRNYLKNLLNQNLKLPLIKTFYLVILLVLILSLISLINGLLAIFISLSIHVLFLPLFLRLKLIKIEKKGVEKESLYI
ncbi:MAG: hypothetical protein ACPLXL_00040 [Minisyncoccia bacterium]